MSKNTVDLEAIPVVNAPVVDLHQSPAGGYEPAGLPKPSSAVASANDDFEGLDQIRTWLNRVAVSGNGKLLYKYGPKKGQMVDELLVTLHGGRVAWVYYDKPTQFWATSYDGKVTTDGEPWAKYAAMKDNTGRSKGRQCFEIRWFEDDVENVGEQIEYEISLAPTSMTEFRKYADELFRKHGKKVSEVQTRIRTLFVHDVKTGYQYHKATFSSPLLEK